MCDDLDVEIEDLESEGFVVFDPDKKNGRNSIAEAIEELQSLGYVVYKF